MSFSHFLYRLVHETVGGIRLMAINMDKGEKVLGNKLNPNCQTHDLGAKRELEMFIDFIPDGNFKVAEYFAAKANAIVLKLPDLPEMSDMALLDAYMEITKELGELCMEFMKAYADGRIDKTEFKRISKEVSHVQTKLAAFQAAVERVVT